MFIILNTYYMDHDKKVIDKPVRLSTDLIVGYNSFDEGVIIQYQGNDYLVDCTVEQLDQILCECYIMVKDARLKPSMG